MRSASTRRMFSAGAVAGLALPAPACSSPESGAVGWAGGAAPPALSCAGAAGSVFFVRGAAPFMSSTLTREITVGMRHWTVNCSTDLSLATSNSNRLALSGEPASGRAPRTSLEAFSAFRTSCRAATGIRQCGSIPTVTWYTLLPRASDFSIAILSYSVHAAGVTATGSVFFDRFLVLVCCDSSRIIFARGAAEGIFPWRR